VLWTGILGAVAGLVLSTSRDTELEDPSGFHDPVVFRVGFGFFVVCWVLWARARAVALHLEVLAGDRPVRQTARQ